MKQPDIKKIREDAHEAPLYIVNLCKVMELCDYIEELEKEKGKLKETIYQLTGSKHYIF